MEDWIIIDDDKPCIYKNETIHVNNLITQVDSEIETKSYQSNNFFDTVTQEKSFFFSCSHLYQSISKQIKLLHYNFLSIINNLKQNFN